MNNLVKIFLTFLAAPFVIATNVSAEWFVGADISTNEILPYPSSLSDQSLEFDRYDRYNIENNNANVSLFGGYKPTQNFALQLEYQDDLAFGIDDMFSGSSLWAPELNSERFESNGIFLSGIGSYPIKDSGLLYMKGGLFSWEVDSEYDQTSEYYLGQNRGTDIFYGLGASYDLNTRFGISAEWERYQMEESDVDYLSTKFRFKF